jgi:hypothetical protein
LRGFADDHHQLRFVVHVFDVVRAHRGLVVAVEGVRRFDKHQRLGGRLEVQLAGVIGIVQAEGKQRGVRRRAVRNSDVAFVHHRVFQRRKPFRQNTHAIARADLNAAVRGAEQDRIAGIEGGELAQGAQQFGGVTLQIGGVPVVRFAAVDLGDDGQVIHVINGDQFAERAESVPAFGLDGRAVEALFRQAHLVGQRISGDVRRGVLHAHLAGGFADHQRHRGAAQHRFPCGNGMGSPARITVLCGLINHTAVFGGVL